MASVPSWVCSSVFYQIMPDRFYNGDPANDPPGVRPWDERPTRRSFFGGDLCGIEKRLDDLQERGVNGLYLTPIFAAPSTHKYDAGDYLRIDPAFGSLQDFRRLLDAAHSRGMRLLLDGVFNHSGDRHWAFLEAVRVGPSSPYWDWYCFKGYPVTRRPRPNYEHAGIFYLPKWNLRNPAVRAYLLGAVRFWTSQGIDGWRLDVPWYVEGHEFWKEFHRVVRELNPEAYLVGEHWDDASPWLADDEFDGATDYRLRQVVLGFVAGRLDAAEAGRALEELARAYPPEHRLAMWNLAGSHDTPRVATVLRGNSRRIQAAFTLLFTFPGVPLVYYGDEIGLRGRNDPDCRRTFPWQAPESWDRSILEHVAALSRLRRSHPALQQGTFRLCGAQPRRREPGPPLLQFVREGPGDQRAWVLVSNGSRACEAVLASQGRGGPPDVAVSSGSVRWRTLGDQRLSVKFGREPGSLVAVTQ